MNVQNNVHLVFPGSLLFVKIFGPGGENGIHVVLVALCVVDKSNFSELVGQYH